MAPRPPGGGMARSTRATWGRLRRTRPRASSALSVRPATLMRPSDAALRSDSSPRENSEWSSTMTTTIGSLSAISGLGGIRGPVLDVEPQPQADGVGHLLGQVPDQAGGAGQEGEAPDDLGREPEVGPGRPRHAGAA